MLPVKTFSDERGLFSAISSRYGLNNLNLNCTTQYNMNQMIGSADLRKQPGNTNWYVSVAESLLQNMLSDLTPANTFSAQLTDNGVINSLTYLHIVGGTYTASVRLRPSDIMPAPPHS